MFRNSKIRRVAVILCLLAGAFVAPVPVSAADQGTGCPTDPERVRFGENQVGDTSDGNDTVIFCGLGASDLNQIAHTVAGRCNAPLQFEDNWDDCISKMYAVIPAGRVLCLYNGANFTGGSIAVFPGGGGQWVSFAGGYQWFNDSMTSWHFLNDGPQFIGC